MNYNIKHVKKEIRVLGIAIEPTRDNDGYILIGVVFRGKFWLDGAMRSAAVGPDATNELIEMILKSKHYPQIRVIIMHQDLIKGGATLDLELLFKKTQKPIIALKFLDGKIGDINFEHAMKPIANHGISTIPAITFGISAKISSKILKTLTRSDSIPEVLRVARLIISNLNN